MSVLRPIAAAAGVLLLITSTSSAVASTPSTSDLVPVAAAVPTQPLAAGTELGPTDDSTPMQVSFILRERQSAYLSAQVQAGWNRPFLSAAQFAATYGQPGSVVGAIEHYLAGFGIQTYALADNLDISAYGTVGEFGQALSVHEHNVRVQEPKVLGTGTHLATVFAPSNGPTLPRPLASAVLAILGLSNYASAQSHLAMAPQALRQIATSEGGSFANPPSTFADRYNLTPLVNAGARGQGRTVGIITLSDFDPSNAYTFWNDVLGLGIPHGRIAVEHIDGFADANGSLEDDLDVEESGAIAPDATIKLYMAPNDGASSWADAFFTVASENVADSVSVSWGNSETVIDAITRLGYLPSTYLGVLDEAYLEMAAQGQTAFAASGDQGAYQAIADVPSTNLSVNYPSDSPYVTSAGGTTLPTQLTFTPTDFDLNQTRPSNTAVIPAERAWGSDYLWPLYQAMGYPTMQESATDIPFGWQSGGGGGFSTMEPRPTYQSAAIAFQYRKFLNSTDPQLIVPNDPQPTAFTLNPTPPLSAGISVQGRGEPDLATDADTFTGYEIYDAEFGGLITSVGGTSAVAPQLAAAAAVIDSATGGRTGFWNPAMYRAAALRVGSPFTPLNSTAVYSGIDYLYATALDGTKTALPGEFSNDNLYYTGRAGGVWNPATGLGTPDLARVAQVVRRS